MSHYAIIVPPLFSHIRAMEALALHLSGKGHRLTFILHPSLVTCDNPRIGGCPSLPDSVQRAQQRFRSPAARTFFCIAGTLAAHTDALCHALPGILKRLQVDGAIVDQMEPAGGLVSEFLGLPFVSVACALPVNREPDLPLPVMPFRYGEDNTARRLYAGSEQVYDRLMQAHYRVIDAYSRRFGLPRKQRLDECLSPLAQIAQGCATFDFPRRELPDNFHYIGTFQPLPELPARRRNDAPQAFATLGTLQGHQYSLLRTLARACHLAGVNVTIAHCDGLSPAQVDGLYRNGAAQVESFVPQHEVLRQADMTLCHAGLNTVLEAISVRCPSIVMPVAFDQPAVAARVVYHGLGRKVSRLASASTIASQITALLNEGSDYHQRLAQVSQAIRQAGGAARAANLIEQALDTGRPVNAGATRAWNGI
ncbi:glycosyltransferase [Atlantibacter sp.]|uniref:glycosyltransferase n=1 Tax=Atlantibacter sp. TaxID=1903473 RepID=UPI0028A947F7|nr:glycosyltransferase [Atlantibacter sp.]